MTPPRLTTPYWVIGILMVATAIAAGFASAELVTLGRYLITHQAHH